MKCIYLLFYFILISSTIADDYESCKIQGYSLIQNQSVLLSFKETIRPHNAECDGKYWLYMSNKNIKSISENAFSDLQIYGLKIKASNNGLELSNKSFSGLPFLKSLYFYSPIKLNENKINIFEKLGELINLQLIEDFITWYF
ncbi:hypothetical protein HCN44_005907 [Aphidius gifuensis]|uniref:Odorant-binding protein n=1 Tax=Aphidius gifuensis TaxID=684658 RepID=A0A834XVZ8_APHGI|nr:hypothetical protein HCN44_005907 [Aphidius gifuensis]